MLTSTELQTEMVRLSRQLDKGVEYLTTAAQDFATADAAYKRVRAQAFLEADGAMDMRSATADLAAAKERFDVKLADGMRQAALEAVRSRRQQISALQSLAGAMRAEAGFAMTGPSNLEGQ